MSDEITLPERPHSTSCATYTIPECAACAKLRQRVEFIEQWMCAYEAAIWMPPVDRRITGSAPQ